MQIIRYLEQVERDTIAKTYQGHHLFSTHIEPIVKQQSCLVVNLFVEDYAKILIYSGIYDGVSEYPYQTLSAAISYVEMNQSFLNTTSMGFLDGQRVEHYLSVFREFRGNLQDCFVGLPDCFMLDKDDRSDKFRNEITDGMHRLVAYGLVSKLEAAHFPIPIYFGTPKNSLQSLIE